MAELVACIIIFVFVLKLDKMYVCLCVISGTYESGSD